MTSVDQHNVHTLIKNFLHNDKINNIKYNQNSDYDLAELEDRIFRYQIMTNEQIRYAVWLYFHSVSRKG